jgi:hypothetical protein
MASRGPRGVRGAGGGGLSRSIRRGGGVPGVERRGGSGSHGTYFHPPHLPAHLRIAFRAWTLALMGFTNFHGTFPVRKTIHSQRWCSASSCAMHSEGQASRSHPGFRADTDGLPPRFAPSLALVSLFRYTDFVPGYTSCNGAPCTPGPSESKHGPACLQTCTSRFSTESRPLQPEQSPRSREGGSLTIRS